MHQYCIKWWDGSLPKNVGHVVANGGMEVKIVCYVAFPSSFTSEPKPPSPHLVGFERYPVERGQFVLGLQPPFDGERAVLR